MSEPLSASGSLSTKVRRYAFALYKDHELFLFKPDWIRNPEESLLHEYETLGNLGIVVTEDLLEETVLRFRTLFSPSSKSEIQRLLDFFDEMIGRFGNFWVPSWKKDIIVSTAFDAAAITLDIQGDQYAAVWFDSLSTGHFLYFKWPDGEYKCRKVVGVPSTTQITLESAIDKACGTNELSSLLVSFLYFVRFDQDEVEAEYETEEDANILLAFRTLPYEAFLL